MLRAATTIAKPVTITVTVRQVSIDKTPFHRRATTIHNDRLAMGLAATLPHLNDQLATPDHVVALTRLRQVVERTTTVVERCDYLDTHRLEILSFWLSIW